MRFLFKLFDIFKNRKNPFKYLLAKFLIHSKLCVLFSIKRKHYKLRFYPSNLSLISWLYPDERMDEEIFFSQFLKISDNVIDVGANIGTITLLMNSLVTNSGKVFSIEANPKTFEYLKGNVIFNKRNNITLFNVALGEIDGEVMFSDNYLMDDENKIVNNGTGIKVPIRRIDELGINESIIHLLKIDVEGFEIFVLKGAEKILKRTYCIYFESWESHYNNYNYSTSDILAFLSYHGFKCYRFNNLYSLTEVSNNYISSSCENMIAIKDIALFKARTEYKFT